MLKFNTEAECIEMLYDQLVWENQNISVPKYTAVDNIGIIFEQSEDPMTPIAVEGWHANVRHVNPAPELEAYRVFPVTPFRVWA